MSNRSTVKTIPVRRARDRLIDLLGFGQTYPLRDLPVRDERLTVPPGSPAKIPLELSQPDVVYALYFKDGQPVSRPTPEGPVPIELNGSGGTIKLETGPIENDITYYIRAEKQQHEDRFTFLHETATVKVGLDLGLHARILGAPTLDPLLDEPVPDTAARIVDFSNTVEVEVDDSQEGVDYRLVHFPNGEENPPQEELSESVRGTSAALRLRSKPLQEDTVIRIRVVKEFDPSEERETLQGLLTIALPIKVRANPSPAVTVLPSPIIEFAGQAQVRIAQSQTSVRYALFVRQIRDRDYLRGAVDAAEVVRVDRPGELLVQVRKPSLETELWKTLAGFVPVGDSKAGNGGELDLPLQPAEDTLLLIQATKEHALTEETGIQSAIPLAQAALVLVRPDANPDLRLAVVIEGDHTDGRLWVLGGQPGIFYHFRTQEAPTPELAPPAYIHKRDETDPSTNKGLNQLAVEVDFVVAADPPEPAVGEAPERAKIPPPPPILELGRWPVGTTLFVRAEKAQTRWLDSAGAMRTGLETALVKTASLPVTAEIRAQESTVTSGTPARILVLASHQEDRYELTRNGQRVGPPADGTGADLVFASDPLSVDTEFTMRVTRPGDTGISLERWVRILVRVQASE